MIRGRRVLIVGGGVDSDRRVDEEKGADSGGWIVIGG